MTKIYIDVSSLLQTRFLTGIQRVVRSICGEFLKNHPDEVVLLSDCRETGRFRVVSHSYFEQRFLVGKGEAELTNECLEITLDDMAAGSVFFDLDSAWAAPQKRSALVPELKARGIRWTAYVYDVCPVTYPQYAHPNTVFQFVEFFGTVIRHADAVVVSTRASADALRHVCAEIGRPCPPVHVSWLGCDFDMADASAPVNEDVVASLTGRKYLLAVGTIEPRKNHALLLDVFDTFLLPRGVSLVLVGRFGWNCTELRERISSSAAFGRSLFHFQGIDDATLDWLYAHAFASVMPTYAEGFGLPLVESLLKGVPALVSDIPVMREVGGDYAVYFDNQDENDFIRVVGGLLDDEARYAALREKVKYYRGVTWAEVGGTVYAALETLAPPARKPRTEVRQFVLLTARFEDAQTLLPYIDRFMPFIDRVLLLCPDALAARRDELLGGRLRLSFLCDSQILDGEPLPEDHAKRNFFLRCRAMKSDLLEDVFIMSDDDYRPMTTIKRDIFVDEAGYKGYFSYDLRNWRGSTSAFSSFDQGVFAELAFLLENDYPTRQYAAHMPEIIDKAIFLEMLAAHPGMETKGFLDWDVYFNYLQAKYPTLLEVRPYVTMGWPGAATDWPVAMLPPRYLFENHYAHLYGEGQIFVGIPDVLDENYEENCRRKIARYDGRLRKFHGWQSAYSAYERLYERRSGFKPFFKVRVSDDSITVHLPDWIDLPEGGFVRVTVYLEGPCDGLAIHYVLRDAQGNAVYDIKDHPVRIVPEPPALSLPVFSAPGMATFEMHARRGGSEFMARAPIAKDRPIGPQGFSA